MALHWVEGSPGNNIIGQSLSPVRWRRRVVARISIKTDSSHFAFTSRKRLIWTHSTGTGTAFCNLPASIHCSIALPVQNGNVCPPSAAAAEWWRWTPAPPSTVVPRCLCAYTYSRNNITATTEAMQFDSIKTETAAVECSSCVRTNCKEEQWTLTNQYSWSHNQWTGCEVNDQNDIKQKSDGEFRKEWGSKRPFEIEI